MKRDHEEEFEQDQDANQEGLNDVECNNLENNDFSEMNNPSEDSASNQQQTDLIQPLLDPSSIQHDGNPAKRQKRSDDEEIRLLIPSKFAGAIIGKGGQNIQKLRSEFRAQVNLGDCSGPERVITIASDIETCCTIIRDILQHFDKTNGDEFELRVLLHQSLAGCVIGKNGTKIKEIKELTGCRLKIFSNIAPQSTDRIAQVIGKEEQCIESLKIIVDLLKSTPIKGPVHNYDPHNFDDVYADEYGGFGSGSAAAGGQGGMRGGGQTRFDQRGGGGNRFGGEKSLNREGNRPPRASGTRDFIDPWAHNGSNANNQIGSNFGGSFNDSSNFMSSNGNNGNGSSVEMENKSSTQVTIPKDLAGAIIGKGGGRIRRIRSESNAFIQIDEALPGSTDRIITITGTAKQIQTAQYMLQQSVRENVRK